MRPRLPLAAAAGGAVLVTAVLAASGSAQAPGPRTLTFTEVERGSTFGFVDNPPRARQRMGFPVRVSVGDQLSLTQRLRGQGGQPGGAIRATCTVTRGHRRFDRAQFVCHGVTTLRDGTIALQVPVRFADTEITGAITGGTGAYNGARGTFTSKGGDERPSVDTYELLP